MRHRMTAEQPRGISQSIALFVTYGSNRSFAQQKVISDRCATQWNTQNTLVIQYIKYILDYIF